MWHESSELDQSLVGRPRANQHTSVNQRVFEESLLNCREAVTYQSSANINAECSFYSDGPRRILRSAVLQAASICKLESQCFHQGSFFQGLLYDALSWQNIVTEKKTVAAGPLEMFLKVVTAGTYISDLGPEHQTLSLVAEIFVRKTANIEDAPRWLRPLLERIAQVRFNQRMVFTDNCLLGLVPNATKIDDIICVLFGCCIPLVFRQQQNGRYSIIGESYVDGLMEGETMTQMEEGKLEKMSFDIE